MSRPTRWIVILPSFVLQLLVLFGAEEPAPDVNNSIDKADTAWRLWHGVCVINDPRFLFLWRPGELQKCHLDHAQSFIALV